MKTGCVLAGLYLATAAVVWSATVEDPLITELHPELDGEQAEDLGFEGPSYVSLQGSVLPAYWRQALSDTRKEERTFYDPLVRMTHGPRPRHLRIVHVDLRAPMGTDARAAVPPAEGLVFPDGGHQCTYFAFRGTLRAAGDDRSPDGMALFRDPPFRLHPDLDYVLTGKVRVRVNPQGRLADPKTGSAVTEPRGGARLGLAYLYRDDAWPKDVYHVWVPQTGRFEELSRYDPRSHRIEWTRPPAIPVHTSEDVPLVPGDSLWRTVTVRMRPPEGATHVQVICEVTGTEAEADVWFDALRIVTRPSVTIQAWLGRDLRAAEPRFGGLFEAYEPVRLTVAVRGLGAPRKDEYAASLSVAGSLDPNRRVYLAADGRTFTGTPELRPLELALGEKGIARFEAEPPFTEPSILPAYGTFRVTVEVFRQGRLCAARSIHVSRLPPFPPSGTDTSASKAQGEEGLGLALFSPAWNLPRLTALLDATQCRWIVVPLLREDLPPDGRTAHEDPLYRMLIRLAHRRMTGGAVDIVGAFHPLPQFLRHRAPDPARMALGIEQRPIETFLDLLALPLEDRPAWKDMFRGMLVLYGPLVREFIFEGEPCAPNPRALSAFREEIRASHRGAFTFPARLGEPAPAMPDLPEGEARRAWKLPDAWDGSEAIFAGSLPGAGDMLVIPLPGAAADESGVPEEAERAAAGERARVERLWKAMLYGLDAGYRRFLIANADGANANGGLLSFDASATRDDRAAPDLRHPPDHALVAARVLNHTLSGARPSARPLYLPESPDVRTRVYFRSAPSADGASGERAVLVYWADREMTFRVPLEAGVDAAGFDLFGNRVNMPPAKGPLVLRADRVPRFLTGLASAQARTVLALKTDPVVQSRWQLQPVPVTIPNQFQMPIRMRVRAQVVDPQGAPAIGWRIDPPMLESDGLVAPGESRTFTFQMRPPFTQAEGAVPLKLEIETRGVGGSSTTGAGTFEIRRPLVVKSSIRVEVESWSYTPGAPFVRVHLAAGWNEPDVEESKLMDLNLWVETPDGKSKRIDTRLTGVPNRPGLTVSTRRAFGSDFALAVPVPPDWEKSPPKLVLGARENDGDRFMRREVTLDPARRE